MPDQTRLSQILAELEDWRKLPRAKVLMLMGEYQVLAEREIGKYKPSRKTEL